MKHCVLALLFLMVSAGTLLSRTADTALLFNEKNEEITLHKNVSRPKTDENEVNYGIEYKDPYKTVKGQKTVSIITEANFGFEGDVLSFEIRTDKNEQGWVRPENIWIIGKVKNVRSDDVLNIRSGKSANSKILDKLKNGETVYINWKNYMDETDYVGEDGQWLRVYTRNKVLGYAKINYLEIPQLQGKRLGN